MTDAAKLYVTEVILSYGQLLALATAQAYEGRLVVFTGYGDALPAKRLTALGVGEIFLKASIDFERLL